MKTEPHKTSYHDWARQIIGDIKRMTNPKDGYMTLGVSRRGLYVAPRPGQTWADTPGWLGMLKAIPEDKSCEPLEMVCCYRCPWKHDKDDGASWNYGINDPWVAWTERAAKGLFALNAGWVRFFMHTLAPWAIAYHKNRDYHTDWAGKYWAALTGWHYQKARRAFEAARSNAEWSHAGCVRMNFWTKEVSEPSLWE